MSRHAPNISLMTQSPCLTPCLVLHLPAGWCAAAGLAECGCASRLQPGPYHLAMGSYGDEK